MSMYIHTMRVCVNHLKRCKTSSGFTWSFFILLLTREMMLNFSDFCRHYFISFQAGGTRPSCKRMPTKLCMMVEAGADHPGVPALSFPFSAMGRG